MLTPLAHTFWGSAPANITVTGQAIASGEAIGSGGITITHTTASLVSAENIPNSSITLRGSNNGLVSAETFGSHGTTINGSYTGIASLESVGLNAINLAKNINAIASAEGLGNSAISLLSTGSGFSSFAFDSPNIHHSYQATSINSVEAVGGMQASILNTAVEGIFGETFGSTQTLIVSSYPAINSQEVLGEVYVNGSIHQGELPSEESVGSARVDFITTGSGFGSESVLSPANSLFIMPSGTNSLEGFGSISVVETLAVSPTGILSAELLGGLIIEVANPVDVLPSSIVSAQAFGMPTVTIPESISVVMQSIFSNEAFGNAQLINDTVPDVIPELPAPRKFGPADYFSARLVEDGTMAGKLRVPSTQGLIKNATIFLTAQNMPIIELIVDEIIDNNYFFVKVKGGYSRWDCSGYTMAKRARVTQPKQYVFRR